MPTLDGYSGPRPVQRIDLAGTWDFDPVEEASGSIEVPGGGWYKQGYTETLEATYTRRIAIPRRARGKVVKLELGAVNHEATVSVDGKEVGTQLTSFTPQSFDLTRFVRPGATHELKIHVKGRGAFGTPRASNPPGYVGPIYTVPDAAEWCEAVPQGIFRSAKLAIYPKVHVSDVFVRPSVRSKRLAYDVWVRNSTSRRKVVTLVGKLRSASGKRWRYPRLPRRRFAVGAGKTRRVTVRRVPWRLGRPSWWWPNVPYRAGYRAQLHDLRLTTRVGPRHRARWVQRFGFREFRQVGTHYELNGVRVNLRGDSLQGANYDRIDHNGRGDAFHTYPGFLPPSAESPGWPKAVDNYLRLNYNHVRIHQEPASPYMLDVADEMGLLITSETAIRGSQQRQDFNAGRENFVSHMRDLVLRDRNHASVIRWSQANEPDAGPDSLEFEQQLYATVMKNDRTRPVSIDVTSETYEEMDYDNFSVFQHYVNEDGSIGGYTDDVHPRDDRPFGRGEYIWPLSATRMGFTWFGTSAEKMREKAASDIRPYALLSAWASVIPGVRTTDFQTEEYFHPLYGEDNLPDPWANEQIQRVQAGFNPVLVADRDYWEQHKRSDVQGNWPTPLQRSSLAAGEKTTRTLVVFNDTVKREPIDVRWELRKGAADGAVAASGEFRVSPPLGGRLERTIEFTPPADASRVYLVLSSRRAGREEFKETKQWFDVD